jgi:hypothetical protein
MQPAPKEDIELEAAWTVAALVAGRPARRDKQGAPDGTHDFDILLPDGRTIALEVTSSTVGEVVGMWKAIRELDWCIPGLTRSWSAQLQAAGPGKAGTAVRRFHQQAAQWFNILGAEVPYGAGDVIGDAAKLPLSEKAKEAVAKLKALGAKGATAVDATVNGGKPAIVVGTVGPGGFIGWSAVDAAVETALTDNADKLAKASADERHLFLWVDNTDNPSYVAMATFSPAGEAPNFKGRADVVWVGLWMNGVLGWTNVHSLWKATSGSAWEQIRVPDTRAYAERVKR